MKLFFVTYSLRGGGAERVFTSVVEYLSQKEYEVHVLTFEDEGVYADRIKALDGVIYHTLDLKNQRVNFIRQSIKIRRLAKAIAPDKIVSFLHYPNMISYLAIAFTGIKHIPAERSNHRKYIGKGLKWKLWRFLLKRTHSNAALILCNSHQQKAYLAEDFKIASDKIEVIHNGINLRKLDQMATEKPAIVIKDHERVIVAVGRMAKVKGYDLLIRSFKQLVDGYPEANLRLLIVGEGPELGSLTSLAGELDIIDQVTFCGFQTNPFAIIKHASVYVLSSRYEGFPNALIEGMYVNGYAVAADCETGPNEIISDGEDGVLVRPNDVESLTDGLKRMLFDEDLRKSVYLNSRQKSKSFDIQKMYDAYERVLGN